ncbi:tyrosine-type recombinase/integrase [Synechocystis sp. PCC 7509]|uniref:tyrosine-type recombinase/integrase n=1 Tax=Synechocystis sp. PCC 7509 TaxID=927677 RepID=UPI0002AC9CAF|nr:site-specific integrase [Synechocystis sp. PCC 7509]
MNSFELILEKNYPFFSQSQEIKQLLKNPLLKKNVWQTVEDLGLKIKDHQKISTINFNGFSQHWFELSVKVYTLVKAKIGFSVSTIKIYVGSLKTFSCFLKTQSIDNPAKISNQTFESFDYYLKTKKITEGTTEGYYKALCSFFEFCRIENLFNVNTYWFKGKFKLRCPTNEQINYIPENIWNQLEQNLYYFPETLQRMVLVIRTTGMRIGELLNMPFDCLRKRKSQWRLRFTTEKFNIEDELPIPLELVAVIKEQQYYIRQNLDKDYEKLFCGSNAKTNVSNKLIFQPQPKVMSGSTFNKWLNRLAKKSNICSHEGELWHFTSHQFRRTVATVMTNAGVRDLIIQKYLRHRSPNMQRHYKHLLKQVLGEEYQELMREKKYVDIAGKVITTYQPKNPITELIRRKMHSFTTQYGECHRPIVKSPCQTVNACWRCEHWRTSNEDLVYLKEDLKRVEEELKTAQVLKMVRQQQGLENDQNSLMSCIKGLEKLADND